MSNQIIWIRKIRKQEVLISPMFSSIWGNDYLNSRNFIHRIAILWFYQFCILCVIGPYQCVFRPGKSITDHAKSWRKPLKGKSTPTIGCPELWIFSLGVSNDAYLRATYGKKKIVGHLPSQSCAMWSRLRKENYKIVCRVILVHHSISKLGASNFFFLIKSITRC